MVLLAVAVSLSWMSVVTVWPSGSRPYVDGSSNASRAATDDEHIETISEISTHRFLLPCRARTKSGSFGYGIFR
jgi:hypothetical protein